VSVSAQPCVAGSSTPIAVQQPSPIVVEISTVHGAPRGGALWSCASSHPSH
jgi:hypothetical protein